MRRLSCAGYWLGTFILVNHFFSNLISRPTAGETDTTTTKVQQRKPFSVVKSQKLIPKKIHNSSTQLDFFGRIIKTPDKSSSMNTACFITLSGTDLTNFNKSRLFLLFFALLHWSAIRGIISGQQQVCTGKCQHNTSGTYTWPPPPLSPESMLLSSLAAVQLNAATLRLGRGFWWFRHYYMPLVAPLHPPLSFNRALSKKTHHYTFHFIL